MLRRHLVGLGFRFQDLGLAFRLRVKGLGRGLGFRVWGLGLRVGINRSRIPYW